MSTTPTLKPTAKGLASLAWFDPGVTTGICIVSVSPKWLNGEGMSDWVTLGKKIKFAWHAQVGRHSRVWDEDKDKALYKKEVRSAKAGGTRDHITNSAHSRGGNLDAILAGFGRNGGGDMLTSTSGELRQITQCQHLLEDWPSAAWGYEDFVPRSLNQSRVFLAPVRVFSMLTMSEILHGSKGRVPFIQSASTAKTTATDERLQAAGLYRPGMPHATDAARHVAAFLRRARGDAELRAQAWPHLFLPVESVQPKKTAVIVEDAIAIGA